MGGRGANLNVGTYLGWGNERRTGEYEVIHSDGNTKFLVQKNGTRISTPIFSNTEGRVYVTLNTQGRISGITQYGADHKAVFIIHEPHGAESLHDVHLHMGYGKDRIRIGWDNMTQSQKDLYFEIKRKCEEYGISEKAKGWYSNNGR